MAFRKNVGNLLGRVARNHLTLEISSSNSSITQAINLGRGAVATNHVRRPIHPSVVERVTVETPSVVERVTVETSDYQDIDGRRRKREDHVDNCGYAGGGTGYIHRDDESYGPWLRPGAGNLTHSGNHGRCSSDGGSVGVWEWWFPGDGEAGDSGDSGSGGGDCGGGGDGGDGGGF